MHFSEELLIKNRLQITFILKRPKNLHYKSQFTNCC
jgi:hypothetical protein